MFVRVKRDVIKDAAYFREIYKWRVQPEPPELGLPRVNTLESSYLLADAWVFEVETLIRHGMARLRQNRRDFDASLLVAEALRRLLVAKQRRIKLKNEQMSTLERWFRGSNQTEKTTAKERYHDELWGLAMGILNAHNWHRDQIDAIGHDAIQNDIPLAMLIGATLVNGNIERRAQPNRDGEPSGSRRKTAT